MKKFIILAIIIVAESVGIVSFAHADIWPAPTANNANNGWYDNCGCIGTAPIPAYPTPLLSTGTEPVTYNPTPSVITGSAPVPFRPTAPPINGAAPVPYNPNQTPGGGSAPTPANPTIPTIGGTTPVPYNPTPSVIGGNTPTPTDPSSYITKYTVSTSNRGQTASVVNAFQTTPGLPATGGGGKALTVAKKQTATGNANILASVDFFLVGTIRKILS